MARCKLYLGPRQGSPRDAEPFGSELLTRPASSHLAERDGYERTGRLVRRRLTVHLPRKRLEWTAGDGSAWPR